MKALVCVTCGSYSPLDADLFHLDNRHDGHNTMLVVDPSPEVVEHQAAKVGAGRQMAGLHSNRPEQ